MFQEMLWWQFNWLYSLSSLRQRHPKLWQHLTAIAELWWLQICRNSSWIFTVEQKLHVGVQKDGIPAIWSFIDYYFKLFLLFWFFFNSFFPIQTQRMEKCIKWCGHIFSCKGRGGNWQKRGNRTEILTETSGTTRRIWHWLTGVNLFKSNYILTKQRVLKNQLCAFPMNKYRTKFTLTSYRLHHIHSLSL